MAPKLFSSSSSETSGSRKALSALLLFTLLFSCMPVMVQPVSATGTVYTVPGDYETLQEAVDYLGTNDVILLTSDINITDTEPAGYVYIYYAGLTIDGGGHTISVTPGPNRYDLHKAFYLDEDAVYTTFKNIVFDAVDYAIMSDAGEIYALSVQNCTFNLTWAGESAFDQRYGIYSDNDLVESSIDNCTFLFTSEYGEWCFAISAMGNIESLSISNNIVQYATGLLEYYGDATNITFAGNSIKDSDPSDNCMICLYGGSGITITGNCFYDPILYSDDPYCSAIAIYSGYTYTGINISGNYYDDYAGEDSDSDGYGDTPYYLTGDLVYYDPMPLMEPPGSGGEEGGPTVITIGPFTLSSSEAFNTTAWAPANGTWNAEAGEVVFSPGVADVNITADRFPSTVAWYFIAWWDDPLDLSTADRPAITRVDGDYDLMQIPMFWHSPSSGDGYCVIVRFITLPMMPGMSMNISGDASFNGYTDTDGVLTLTGCGDIVLSSEGLPSGEFLITVNGEIWTDWSSNGTYIIILNVPCPDAVVVIDFHLESEQSNPGGGGGSGGAGTGGGEESGGTGTEQPPDNALPPAVTNATQQFAGWANETFTFVPEEARTPVAVAAVIGMPAIAIWLLLMLLGIMSKGGGR